MVGVLLLGLGEGQLLLGLGVAFEDRQEVPRPDRVPLPDPDRLDPGPGPGADGEEPRGRLQAGQGMDRLPLGCPRIRAHAGHRGLGRTPEGGWAVVPEE